MSLLAEEYNCEEIGDEEKERHRSTVIEGLQQIVKLNYHLYMIHDVFHHMMNERLPFCEKLRDRRGELITISHQLLQQPIGRTKKGCLESMDVW